MNMQCDSLEYDRFAEEVFGPIYPDIAKVILERSGVTCGRLLDLGCGGGHLGFALMELGDFDASFLDLREGAVALAQKRGEALGRSGSFVVGDVHHLPFSENSFDLIVSRGSMPFWEDQEKAFREIFRVLAPGGWAYIGGGLGGKEHQERIRAMTHSKTGSPCFDRSKSRSLPDSKDYVKLFQTLGAPCRVIENPDEGRWFLFGKNA